MRAVLIDRCHTLNFLKVGSEGDNFSHPDRDEAMVICSLWMHILPLGGKIPASFYDIKFLCWFHIFTVFVTKPVLQTTSALTSLTLTDIYKFLKFYL